MAETTDNKVISKTNTGFPDYLDFEKLRSLAIDRIGKLSGKIWTDHNVHDPGITILETLIYAMMDLGYRTSLPVADLLARDPQDKSADNNFFSPTQILGNNPLTMIDLRKMLIEIKEVINAWLEVDENTPVDVCKTARRPTYRDNYNNTDRRSDTIDLCACENINGLYHVYVQLEEIPGADEAEQKKNYQEVIGKIRKSLMAHRNLCEDYIDIKVLCKLEIGLCADIELESDADVEEVYLLIVSTLKEFFSPTPHFYTFQQLLDKGKTVDEIYAGRPFDITESNGFIDTDEFEKLELRKDLHLSDVYHVLFDLKGVRNVRNLGWLSCCDNGQKKAVPDWLFRLPPDHIPAFSTKCSGFRFLKLGSPVRTDLSQFDLLLNMNLPVHPKGLYKFPSPYLEPELPKANYRADLAQYYSIQNELPKVYGISEGGLPSDSTVHRKAQARQLQGFLLFFDQLLANYLTQLKNIRTLFALNSSDDKTKNHTYFINQLTDAPGFKELSRFNTEEGLVGNEGNILAYPTPRNILQDFIDQGKLKNARRVENCSCAGDKDFPEYKFCFATERDQAVLQLQGDLLNSNIEPVIVSNADECYFFYFFSTSADFAMISKDFYPDEKTAKNAAASLKYAGTIDKNYRRFILENCANGKECFSFDVELNVNTYAIYLQQIVEEEELYLARRQGFLNHLLSRFAERFTDYALLNSGFLTPQKLKTGQIRAEERFLTHYNEISSCRGKAYDYAVDGWNVDNTSGFEKRFKALAGIKNWDRHYLCNFVIEPVDEQYRLLIELFDRIFKEEDKVFGKEAAISSLKSIYEKIGNKPQFEIEPARDETNWQIYLRDKFDNKYTLTEPYQAKEKAEERRLNLEAALNFKPSIKENVQVVKYIFKVRLLDMSGKKIITENIRKFDDKETAEIFRGEIEADLSAHLKNHKEFPADRDKNIPGKLILRSKNPKVSYFINEDEFQHKTADVYRLNLVKRKLSIINKEATWQFDSLADYENDDSARVDFTRLLIRMHDRTNYAVERDKDEEVEKIYILEDGQKRAIYFETFPSDKQAWKKVDEIIAWVNSQSYQLTVSLPVEETWEIRFHPVNPDGEGLVYQSRSTYPSEETAWKAVQNLFEHINLIELKNEKEELVLRTKGSGIRLFASPGKDKEKVIAREEATTRGLASIFEDIQKASKDDFTEILRRSRINKEENYVYKLVDKDNLPAYYPCSRLLTTLADGENKRKELINRAGPGYNYIDICLSGDEIFHERNDPKTRAKRYHYLIKCNNRYYKDESKGKIRLVLFESILGYGSKEEAQKAFDENYLSLLKKARLALNYGVNKTISLVEMLRYDVDPCNRTVSVVFIPKKTAANFGGYEIQRDIIPLVKSYPVRLISKEKYRFVLGYVDEAAKTINIDWCSTKTYKTPSEAMNQFFYLLMLLEYTGNFFIEKDEKDCRYHIYIREVLAVSARGFKDPETAWGQEGVEKFICESQSIDGFHNYWNRIGCYYSFYVACGNTGLVHPCTYETPRRRDTVLSRLYHAAKFNFFELFEPAGADWLILKKYLKPGTGGTDEIARINITGPVGSGVDPCDRLVQFVDLIREDKNFVSEAGGFIVRMITDNKVNNKPVYFTVAESVGTYSTLEEWRKELRKVVFYFPPVKKDGKYYVDIKLPEFETGGNIISPVSNCGNDEGEADCKISCYTAWTSECCFETCCEALEFYAYAFILLQAHEHYKPVYDCECGSYRIELHPELNDETNAWIKKGITKWIKQYRLICPMFGNIRKEYNRKQPREFKCLSEIVAINPQHYSNEKMACEAVERSRKLINSEGLHLVEHILLRPRCKNEKGEYLECDCEALPRPCVPGRGKEDTICHFKWMPGGDPDPCELFLPLKNGKKVEKTICFTPGCDPYSFIATVVLPAWPERFRSPAGRQIIERMLRRETPAHIMIRILWMGPRDFCCFEYYFKEWNEWLANRRCDPDYSNCNFLDILFKKKLDLFLPCTDCQPCTDSTVPEPDCFEDEKIPCADFDMNVQVNQLFCWSATQWTKADLVKYKNCEPCSAKIVEEKTLQPKGPDHGFIEAGETDLQAEPSASLETDLLQETDAPAPGEEKSSLFRARLNGYKENVKKIKAANPENIVVTNADTFLLSSKPEPKRFIDMVFAILKNHESKGKHVLNKEAMQELVENIIWKYLDLYCLSNKNMKLIDALTETFWLLRESGLDMESVYKKWGHKKVVAFEPSVDYNEIRRIMMGT